MVNGRYARRALAALLLVAVAAACAPLLAGCKSSEVRDSSWTQSIVQQSQRVEQYIQSLPSGEQKDRLMQAWYQGKVSVSAGELTRLMREQGREVWFYSDDIVVIREDVLPMSSSPKK